MDRFFYRNIGQGLEPIGDDNPRLGVVEGELFVSMVEPSDQGEYVCSATNNAGTATASTQLNVYSRSCGL